MNESLNFDVDCDTFAAKRIEGVGILTFKKDFLLRTADLTDRDRILDYLDLLSKEDRIKAVVLIGAPDAKGREEYLRFFRQVFQLEKNPDFIHRMLNVVSQIILKIVAFNKIVVHANSGNVLSHFLNLSLACDYSIFADNTIIQNPAIELGMVPTGGGAYFLSKFIGRNKAYEILLSDKDINAQEALKLGIVNKIVPVAELEASALDTANRFARKPAGSLSGIKKLMNYAYKDLTDYMDFENQVFINMIRYSDFWQNLYDQRIPPI
jgi:2-(1,2-epoxy-1,2-dihydrophenyl)acetyl-CoA isomerase